MTTSDGVMCRFCGDGHGEIVLDLGGQPACDHFPSLDDPEGRDPVYPLRLWLCTRCRLAQLAEDPTVPDEPRAVEPRALLDQATEAVGLVARAGLLPAGGRVVEYASPHGGSWMKDLTDQGLVAVDEPGSPADVIVDCLGLMHEADTVSALRERARRLAPGGTLLIEYHSLAAVIVHRQWNQVRHGHPVYLSTPALVGMLAEVGLTATSAWWFPLYGGTVLLAARHEGEPDASLTRILAEEDALGVTDAEVLRTLQEASVDLAETLRHWVVEARGEGRRVLAYGAASRAVALLNRAGLGPDLVECVADASEAKQGRSMPGVKVPIVAPDVLDGPGPLDVLVLVPDLLDEVRARFGGVEAQGGRWIVTEPAPRVVPAASDGAGSAQPAEGVAPRDREDEAGPRTSLHAAGGTGRSHA
jgi:hypothetical protein